MFSCINENCLCCRSASACVVWSVVRYQTNTWVLHTAIIFRLAPPSFGWYLTCLIATRFCGSRVIRVSIEWIYNTNRQGFIKRDFALIYVNEAPVLLDKAIPYIDVETINTSRLLIEV
jgi:hypothetical protein